MIELTETIKKVEEEYMDEIGKITLSGVGEHKKFPKIPRASNEIITITEKIDGSNGLIYIDEDTSVVRAGSRNRWIEPGKQDNHGFAAWVEENNEDLKMLGPGYHYGEWMGQGIQRGYGLDHKRFYLFNVGRWSAYNKPNCCHVVPIVGVIGGIDIFKLREFAFGQCSYAVPDYDNPEGFIYHYKLTGKLYKVIHNAGDKKDEE